MKPVRLLVTAVLVASVFSILPILSTPAFASGAGTITCPLTFTVNAGQTGTVPCTFTYSNADGTTVTFSTACATGGPLFCTGWTIGSPSPASIPTTSGGSGSSPLNFQVTAPATCNGAGPDPCQVSVQITATGGGLATVGSSSVVAVATVLISTPEFGVAAVSVVAISLLGLLMLRRRVTKATPFVTMA